MAEVDLNGVKYPRWADVREVEKSILGDRWKIKEMIYQSGNLKGKLYYRYHSNDGKYRDLLSANKAVESDCAETGRDLSEALAELNLNREIEKQKKAEEIKKAKEQAGMFKGAQREEAIAYFQSQYGSLKGPNVQAFPGWTTNMKLLAKCGQCVVTYIEPGGELSWKLLKDLEASLAHRLRTGTEEEIAKLRETISAGFANTDEAKFAELRQKANEDGTQYTYTQPGYEAQLAKKRKVEEKEEVEFTVLKAGPAQGRHKTEGKRKRHSDSIADVVTATDEDYVDHKGLMVQELPLEKVTAEEVLREAGVAGPEELAERALELRARLATRGFPEDNKLLAVCDSSVLGEDAIKRPAVLSRLCGLYFRKQFTSGGDRPCYQKVLPVEGGKVGLVCDSLYIWWDGEQTRWKLGGTVGQCKAGFAYLPGDVPTPAVAKCEHNDATCWRLLRGDFPWKAEPSNV